MTSLVNGYPPAWEATNLDTYVPTVVETPAIVLANDATKGEGGWADPEDFRVIDFASRTTLVDDGTLFLDATGRPLNPAGPTGKAGRILGKWGPNLAADPIVLRAADDDAGFDMLAIERRDTGAWAIPGGMVDAAEEAAAAAARELLEECGVALDFTKARCLYRGIVARDPRNTDHAWMETTVLALVLDPTVAATIVPVAGDDARRAKWMRLTPDVLDHFYADHAAFVREALAWAHART